MKDEVPSGSETDVSQTFAMGMFAAMAMAKRSVLPAPEERRLLMLPAGERETVTLMYVGNAPGLPTTRGAALLLLLLGAAAAKEEAAIDDAAIADTKADAEGNELGVRVAEGVAPDDTEGAIEGDDVTAEVPEGVAIEDVAVDVRERYSEGLAVVLTVAVGDCDTGAHVPCVPMQNVDPSAADA